MKRMISLASLYLYLGLVSIAEASSGSLESPLKPEIASIPTFISMALKLLVMVSLPIISLFIVYSGFLFVLARGNEARLTEAKTNFLYVILGSILILGAWVLATLIGGTAAQLTNT
ncbi:MAG: hypothetical protein JO019_01635 [Candidatus Kaiserbacteria bacterium]|nr:hypothetical protein [Candidatus Kaiserbacteria bacterium]